MSIKHLLSVMQLSDSLFPSGLYSISNGLEYIFLGKKIKNKRELYKLIKINITQNIGPSDCVVVSNVYNSINSNSFDGILEADSICFASKPVQEIRDVAVRSGIQLLKCITLITHLKLLKKYHLLVLQKKSHGIFPVSFALSCYSLHIDKQKSLAILLYGYTTCMIGAALRLGIINHLEGQEIIHNTKPLISFTINKFKKTSISDMWQFTPQMDIFQCLHEKMDSKMFIT